MSNTQKSSMYEAFNKKIKIDSGKVKIEISNICFHSITGKKKYLLQQSYKRKILEIFFKTKEKNLNWDSERKLFWYKSTQEKLKLIINIAFRCYLYPEAVFFSRSVKPKISRHHDIPFSTDSMSFLLKKLAFSEMAIFIHLEASGYVPYRFGLHRLKFIKPLFFCFPEQEENHFIINVLNLNSYDNFSFPVALTVLVFRLKPGILKVTVNGLTGLIFFSINFSFSSFCPIFVKKKRN